MGEVTKLEATELIQVMAVACASLETLKYGQASAEAWVEELCQACELPERYDDHTCNPTMQSFAVLDEVFTERSNQDQKWGEQRHGRIEWAMILTEEIGEWAAEVRKYSGGEALGAEWRFADEILESLERAGDGARHWLEQHDWPDRQQRVYDVEKSEKEG